MLEKRKKSTQGDFPVSEVSKGTALQSSATGEARGGAMQTSKAVQRRKTPFFNFRRIQWRQQHWNTFWITSVPLSAVIHERHPSAYSTLGPCPTNPPGGGLWQSSLAIEHTDMGREKGCRQQEELRRVWRLKRRTSVALKGYE